MNKLTEICQKKAEHVAAKKSATSLDDLRLKIADAPKPRGFLCRLMQEDGTALITEIKKASPSKGIIRADFDPVSIAKIYEENGASCLSVLTDEPYFQGHDGYLIAVKDAVSLPILRKDFMIDPYQIYESRALGADCILIIMAALDDDMVKRLYNTAVDLQMDVLIEVHNLEELERAVKINPMMIGVNNRNLKTLKVDLQTSSDLLPHIPDTCLKVAESGIETNSHIRDFANAGYKAFLVGESLMRQDDIGLAVRTLLDKNA